MKRSVLIGGAALGLLAAAATALVTCVARVQPDVAPKEPTTTGDEPVPGDAGAHSCEVRRDDAVPARAELEPAKPPVSVARVAVTVPLARLSSEIDKRVPRGLASAKRKPVGSAGEVTYNVVRGPFSFAVKDNSLVLSTPISVSVSICKPLGPFCPVYGSCHPKLSATASVPLTLDERYGLGKSKVGYGIGEGCNIAGMDQTGRIRGIANQRIGAVKAQIDRTMPDTATLARQWVSEVTRPRAFDGGCARLQPARVEQAAPAIEDGKLRVGVTARGTIHVVPECPEHVASELPPLTVSGAPAVASEASELAAAVSVSWESVESALRERDAIVGSPAERTSEVQSVRVMPVRATAGPHEGQPRVALGLTLTGRLCGDIWVVTRPVVDRKAGMIRFELVDASSPPSIRAWIEQRARVSLPSELLNAGKQLDELLDGGVVGKAQAMLDDPAVRVELSITKRQSGADVVVHRGGLLVVERRKAVVAVVAKP